MLQLMKHDTNLSRREGPDLRARRWRGSSSIIKQIYAFATLLGEKVDNSADDSLCRTLRRPAKSDGGPGGGDKARRQQKLARAREYLHTPPMLTRDEWHDFGTFKDALDKRLHSIDSADYFCNTSHKWLREAWIAGEFGQHVSADRIRLAAESEWPDFEVVLHDGSRLNCESVEADRERRRGHEYRQAKKLGYPIEHASEITVAGARQQIELALSSAIQRKLRKTNPKNHAALVIDLNLGWGVWRPEIEPVIARVTVTGLGRFSSVWTLWSGRLYRTWPDGRLTVETKPVPS